MTLLLSQAVIHAGEFTLILTDETPGTGFSDPTPLEPVGGNSGTTLGQQRQLVLERAAEIIASQLVTSVPIVIHAQAFSGPCSPIPLKGSGEPSAWLRDFPGAPLGGTYYPVALANALAKEDLAPDLADIEIRFNINITDDVTCRNRTGSFYRGLDHNHGDSLDLLSYLLHFIVHGLGFDETTNYETGELRDGLPDVFNRNLRDLSLEKNWPEMTNQERITASTNNPNVVWTGPNVTALLPQTLLGELLVTVDAPPNLAGLLNSREAEFGATRRQDVTAEVVLVQDSGGNPTDACSPLVNDLTGKIALIDRMGQGSKFRNQIRRAEDAGAVAAILVNDNSFNPIVMTTFYTGPAVTIPSVMIPQSEGEALKAALPGVTVSLVRDPDSGLKGTNGPWIRMRTPNTFDPLFSIVHWDASVFPDHLMQPLPYPDIDENMALTLAALKDIGWSLVGEADPEPRLIFSWLSNNQLFDSNLILNNVGSTAATVILEARRNDDGPPLTTTRTIEPMGFLEETGTSLFPQLGDGPGFSVLAKSESTGLAGRWITNSTQSESMASPAQGVAVSVDSGNNPRLGHSLLFGYLPIDENTTSAPVIVSTADQTVDVVLYFYNAAGELIKKDEETAMALAPNRPLAAVISDLLPDGDQNVAMIAHSPDHPITGVSFVFDARFLEPAIGNAQVISFTPPDP